MAQKPRQSSLASQSRRAMSLGPLDPRARRGPQGFSDEHGFFIGAGLFKNQFGELQVDFNEVCRRCGPPVPPGPGPPSCPGNTVWNPVTETCDCETGKVWDPNLQTCVDPPPGGGGGSSNTPLCPDGYYWNGFACVFEESASRSVTTGGDCGCNKASGSQRGCVETLSWMGM